MSVVESYRIISTLPVENKQKDRNNKKSSVLLIILFIFLALFHSLGSTSSLVNGSGIAYVLYASAAILAIFELIPPHNHLLRVFMLTLIASSSAYFFLMATNNPYRLPVGIYYQTEKVTFLDSNTSLKVDPATARWVNEIKLIADDAGWKAGMPLIDLTGGTPGAAVVLAGRSPTTPWLVGGYKGSTSYVQMALSLAEKQLLNSAWILTSPEGVRRVPPEVLNSVGLIFPNNYTLVGRIRTGYRDEEQFLWKPN